MKAIPLSVAAFGAASGIACAQGGADPMADLRACALMERAERLECLDRLSRDIAAGRRQLLDKLAIYCRGGRTKLVVSGPAVSRAGADYAISYRSMTVSRCNLRQVRHRLEPALRSQVTSYGCCSRSPRRGTSAFPSPT